MLCLSRSVLRIDSIVNSNSLRKAIDGSKRKTRPSVPTNKEKRERSKIMACLCGLHIAWELRVECITKGQNDAQNKFSFWLRNA
ncbi:hypothetical protein TNCT_714251 [Trichonephila clavata]|uniref:Uncharacterized protein n=1 Tax=Trichonephila clavata TaxID=2740835 RepID=A0A8X6GSV7_TRICU|nr:hypothetical protein TNCT_714251 [Trichonephila clavata]